MRARFRPRRRTASRREPGVRARAVQHEKIEQTHGELLLAPYASRLYRFGTRRSARCKKCHAKLICKACDQPAVDFGARQTPGPADVLAFLRAPKYGTGGPRGVWWEAKSEDAVKGKARGQSEEQAQFQKECAEVGWDYVLGTVTDLVGYLIAGGWLRRQDVPWYRLPPEAATIPPPQE